MPKARFTVNAFFLGLVEVNLKLLLLFTIFLVIGSFAMTPVRENQSVGQRCL
jgi:hypothetical protein